MARHDLRCPACGAVFEVDIPVSVGARAYCEGPGGICHCFPPNDPDVAAYLGLCQGRLEPVPAIRISAFSDADPRGGRRDFTKFTLPVEDPSSPTGFREETVSSLADIRRLERESEQAERNGEGRRMIWRDYSQDRSQRDQHTMGPDPSQTPSKTYVNGAPVQIRRGDPVVADHGEVPVS